MAGRAGVGLESENLVWGGGGRVESNTRCGGSALDERVFHAECLALGKLHSRLLNCYILIDSYFFQLIMRDYQVVCVSVFMFLTYF